MMKKAIVGSTLILLLNQVTHIFGKLTALRSPLISPNITVICVSKDDGSALTMMYTIHRFLYESTGYFHDTCNDDTKDIFCQISDGINCLDSWNRKGWVMTNSMDTFMGPVLDRRWEAFEVKSLNEYYINLKKMSTIVVPFSVIVISDLNILLCTNKNRTGLCYWIIIGGFEDTRSLIRKCPTGVPQIGTHAQYYAKCTEDIYIKHNAFSRYEWRTYVLIWDSVTQNISLYDLDHLLMSYEDKEDYESPTMFPRIVFSSSRTLFMQSVIRYHNYKFIFTRQKKLLSSRVFSTEINEPCFQFPIGLCEVCDATITLVDIIADNTIGSVVVNGTSSVHGLPTWQIVRIKSNVLASRYVFIIVEPRLLRSNNNHSSLMWAVGNVRKCPPKGCLRKVQTVINATIQTNLMICQKISYHEQVVVNLLSDINLNIELDNANCDLGYIGPDCSLMCETILGEDKDCRGVTVCNANGCTCSPGFQGHNCLTPCNEGLYGHACKKSCGSCRQYKCGPTGICATGCESSANYTYIPPVCQIGISKPNVPELAFSSRTAVVASVPFKWEKNYNKQKLFYLFRIKALDGRFVYRQRKKQIFENTTQLVGIFENLEFDTSYQVMCILFIDQLEITSDWNTVETDCDLPHAPQNFTYSLDSNGIVDLKWLHPRKTCGHDLCCFRIIIQTIISNLERNISQSFENETIEYSVIYNTRDYRKRLNLLPSTVYKIFIQTMTTDNETGNTNSLQFKTSASVGLDGELEISSQKSDPLIILRIPKVLNDTSDSITYIIVIGQDICEQNIKFPKNLLDHVDKDKIKHVWQIVDRPTNMLADNVFTISDSHSGKCPLKDGELCEIMFFITDTKYLNESVIFEYKTSFYFIGPPPTYHAIWFIGVTVFFAAISAAFYFYKK